MIPAVVRSLVTTLALTGLLALPSLVAAGPALALPAPTLGSVAGHVVPDPCSEALRWRILEVDQQFGLSLAEAEAAAREAAAAWNRVAGQELFVFDPEEGFPITFSYDERHGAVQDWLPRQAAVEEMARRMDQERGELEELREELDLLHREHETRLTTLERRWDEYDRMLDYWEERGMIPSDVERQLDREAEELERERRAVNEKGDRLNALADQVNRETRRLNERIQEYNREREQVESDSPLGEIRSGQYRESRRTLGRWNVSVEREIFVFQFDDRHHLVRVLAHEMGHALGLDHSGSRESIMYPVTRGSTGGASPHSLAEDGGGLELTSRDREYIQELCPELR
jgi:predicted Zn-dependent protease